MSGKYQFKGWESVRFQQCRKWKVVNTEGIWSYGLSMNATIVPRDQVTNNILTSQDDRRHPMTIEQWPPKHAPQNFNSCCRHILLTLQLSLNKISSPWAYASPLLLFFLLSMPTDALDLFDRMLTLDPSKRITAEESLQHPFLKDIVCENISPPR